MVCVQICVTGVQICVTGPKMKHSVSKISVLQRDLGVRKQGRVQICAAGPKNGTRKIQKSYFYSAILDAKTAMYKSVQRVPKT